jgi:dihydrofolate reductase
VSPRAPRVLPGSRAVAGEESVDEYRLYFAPIVLGTGKRLFLEGAVPAAMRLTDTTRTTTGLVSHTYERAGKPEYGSFALEE